MILQYGITRMMKNRFILIFVAFFMIVGLNAQNTMRINYHNGSIEDIAIENIDSITFLEKDIESNEASLIGDWLWGSLEQGYYELLTFNDDCSYIGYDNYFVYGFDSMTYGRYVQNGTMLTLQSNGYGYNRRYTWFIMGLTDNSLDVMTKMGRFSYYRLQPETVHLQVSGEPLACDERDSFVFADGVMVGIVDGKLYGMVTGTTYIQKYIASENRIVSYRVVVEP